MKNKKLFFFILTTVLIFLSGISFKLLGNEAYHAPCPAEKVQKERDQIGILLTFAIVAVTWQGKDKDSKRRGHNVAAVLVNNVDNTILNFGLNRNFEKNSPLEHAEMRVIRKAVQQLKKGDYTSLFRNYTLYTSLEPCPMCAGTLLMANVPRVVFGQRDPRSKLITKRLYKEFRPGFSQPIQIQHPLVEKLGDMFIKSEYQSVTRFLKIEKIQNEIFQAAKRDLLNMKVKYDQNERILKNARAFLRTMKYSG